MKLFLKFNFALCALVVFPATGSCDIVSFDYTVSLDNTPPANRFEFTGSTDRSRTGNDVTSVSLDVEAVFGAPAPPDPLKVNFGTLQISRTGGAINVAIDLATGQTGISSAFFGAQGWTITLSDFVFDVGDFIDTFQFDAGNSTSNAAGGTGATDPGPIVNSASNTVQFTLFADTTADDGVLSYQFGTTAVPEPSTFALFGVGLFSAWGIRRRRQESALVN